jgi:hypothetical protein
MARSSIDSIESIGCFLIAYIDVDGGRNNGPREREQTHPLYLSHDI